MKWTSYKKKSAETFSSLIDYFKDCSEYKDPSDKSKRAYDGYLKLMNRWLDSHQRFSWIFRYKALMSNGSILPPSKIKRYSGCKSERAFQLQSQLDPLWRSDKN